MADPFSMMAMAASAGSGILGAVGAVQQGQSQGAMYNYQAGVAGVNAELARRNADYALTTGEQQAGIQGMKARAQIGQTTARMGASGVAVGSGSSKDVLASEHSISQMEQGITRNNAARQAYGYNVDAAMGVAQAGAYNAAADDARSAGNLKAIGSILGGVSSVSSKWSSGTSSGLFGGSGSSYSAGSSGGTGGGLGGLY